MNAIFLLWCLLFFANASVITLIRNNNITCILTEEHRNRTVYLNSAPGTQFRELRSNNANEWIKPDWKRFRLVTPLLTQRWHDIPITDKIDKEIDLAKSNLTSFSACAKETFNMTVWDSSRKNNRTITITSNNNQNETACIWRHFMMQPVEMNATMNFTPKYLLLNNTATGFWKLNTDNEDFYLGSKQSNVQNPSKLLINTTDHGLQCISFFVYLMEECALDLELKCSDENKTRKSVFVVNQWHKVNLPIDCADGTGELFFTRKNISNKTTGFWFLDKIQYEDCNQKIWTAELPNVALEKDNRCLLLETSIIDQTEFCNKTYHYGENCEFNCSGIGIDRDCKGYKMCEGHSDCTCAWGFGGKNCEQRCTNVDRSSGYCQTSSSTHTTQDTKDLNKYSTTITDSTVKITSVRTASLETRTNNFSQTTNESITIFQKTYSTTETSTIPIIPSQTSSGKSPESPPKTTKAFNIIVSALIALLILGSIISLVMYKRYRERTYIGLDEFNNIHSTELQEVFAKVTDDTSIKTNKLGNYLEEELAINNNKLERQFQKLENNYKKSCNIGSAEHNRERNRYNNFLPYDHNRVPLNKMQGMDSNNYINASYLNNYNQNRAFIATQSPKSSTVLDFWRMIWQEKVNIIIMLTNFKEFDQTKCAEYWCDDINQIRFYGPISVRLIAHKPGEFFHRRKFEIWYGLHKMTVQHFQLNYQPETEQPLYANNVAALLQNVEKNFQDSDRPVVVHCSSGSELTGTFILSALALQMAEVCEKVDFFSLAQVMRQQRPNILANLHNYVLAHMVVSECLMHYKYFENLVEKQQSELNQQIQILHIVSLHDQYMRKWEKTADQKYIVVGTNKSYKFLVEEQPTRNTVFDFWRTVYSHGIKTIVFLNQSQSNYQFLFPVYVQLFNDLDCEFAVIQERKSSHYCRHSNILIKTHDKIHNTTEESTLELLEAKDWLPEAATPPTLEHILEVLKAIDKIKIEGQPILIACSDGITATGLFVAIAWIVERFKTCRCDLLYAVRNARRNNFWFVRNFEQLEFIYNASKKIARRSGFITL